MQRERADWILVEGGNPETIQAAVVEHSGLARHDHPHTHQVRIFPLGDGRFGVMFDPPAPPYAFCNLIGWLDDPAMNAGVRRAVGWLTAPADGERYFLMQRPGGTGGDTLHGMVSAGGRVAVYLPDCTVTPAAVRVSGMPEPEFPPPAIDAVSTFEVELDHHPSFGNPRFEVG